MSRNHELYSRFLRYGLNTFEDTEVLELLLGLRLNKKNHEEEAKNLYSKYGSLCEIINASIPGNSSISDFPQDYLIGFQLLYEVANLYLFEKVKEKPYINSSEDVINYLKHSMKGLKVEVFKAIYLNGRNMILNEEDISKGTLTTSAIYPREVIKSALKHNAAALVFAHNHPSGNVNPSQDDIQITKRLVNAANLIDIKVHDHIIIAGNSFYSFADHGLV